MLQTGDLCEFGRGGSASHRTRDARPHSKGFVFDAITFKRVEGNPKNCVVNTDSSLVDQTVEREASGNQASTDSAERCKFKISIFHLTTTYEMSVLLFPTRWCYEFQLWDLMNKSVDAICDPHTLRRRSYSDNCLRYLQWSD